MDITADEGAVATSPLSSARQTQLGFGKSWPRYMAVRDLVVQLTMIPYLHVYSCETEVSLVG